MKHGPITAAPRALPAALLRISDPEKIGEAIDFLIGRLDALSGDPDLEDEEGSGPWRDEAADLEAGELADNEDEPNFACSPAGHGPGCMISDPDACGAHDDGGTANGTGSWDGMPGDPDDAEDSESDYDVGSENEPDFRRRRRRHRQAGGAGCPISDPGGCEHNGAEPDFLDGHSAPFELRIPIYGPDQSRGPVNKEDIERAYAWSQLLPDGF